MAMLNNFNPSDETRLRLIVTITKKAVYSIFVFYKMDLKVSFARPVGPYDMLWNKCVGKFCHVEMSVEMDKDLFRVMVDSNIEQAYSPKTLEDILTRTKDTELKTLNVCFYVMWGDVVSVRFLTNLHDNPLMSPPRGPVYENVTLQLEVEELQTIVGYNLRQLGKPYDIPRALMLLSHITIRLDGEPDKFFCSQLIMHTLLNSGLYVDEIKQLKNINHMTPTNVYDWLTKQKPKTIKQDGAQEKTNG